MILKLNIFDISGSKLSNFTQNKNKIEAEKRLDLLRRLVSIKEKYKSYNDPLSF